jgi:hypothetical protein
MGFYFEALLTFVNIVHIFLEKNEDVSDFGYHTIFLLNMWYSELPVIAYHGLALSFLSICGLIWNLYGIHAFKPNIILSLVCYSFTHFFPRNVYEVH